jgi:hypothetical protein
VVVVHSYMAMATADVLGGTKRRKPNERSNRSLRGYFTCCEKSIDLYIVR